MKPKQAQEKTRERKIEKINQIRFGILVVNSTFAHQFFEIKGLKAFTEHTFAEVQPS